MEAPVKEAEIVDEFEWVDAGDAEGPSRLIRVMGRSHILLVHFPIAWMWLAAAVCWARLRWPTPIARWDLVLMGLTIMALVPALATGWIHHLHIGDDADTPNLPQWHKFFAFVTLGVVGLAFLVRFFSGNGPVNSGHRLACMIMLVGAIAVSVTPTSADRWCTAPTSCTFGDRPNGSGRKRRGGRKGSALLRILALLF